MNMKKKEVRIENGVIIHKLHGIEYIYVILEDGETAMLREYSDASKAELDAALKEADASDCELAELLVSLAKRSDSE